ncbi:hypothetical protein C8034_v004412 [Colletotrichum sidae]|uniref:LysM domain-containing protein n=1 Tax=Colletotrichum sidae TaxID=1347389 RepID=A0A4R8T9C1_9PEZI|nr:hypothetical protein C8034_v004412 [Colletotrichum sidae]
MSKFWRACRWGMDDVFIIAAFVVLISFVPLNILVEKLDTKTVFWNSTPAQVAGYFVVFYVLQALYVICITLIKASILFMYLRIFPDERFRAVLWATQAFNLAVGLTFTLVGLFQCRPVHLGWTWWRQPELREGHCLNVIAETIVHTAIQLMLDVWMLALTATQVLGMNMPLREKLAIMLMFGLGLFLTAVSAVRLKVVVNAPNSTGDSSAIPTKETREKKIKKKKEKMRFATIVVAALAGVAAASKPDDKRGCRRDRAHPGRGWYWIVEGDTLGDIAKDFTSTPGFESSVKEIAKVNNIPNPDFIRAWTTIVVPCPP